MSENLSLDLIEKLVRYISNTKGPGAILIFLPGMMDISNLNKMILESGYYPSCKYTFILICFTKYKYMIVYLILIYILRH